MSEPQPTDTALVEHAQRYPAGTVFVLMKHPRSGRDMAVLPRHAALLASGGRLDDGRGVIIGGDPEHGGLPPGARRITPREMASEFEAARRARSPLGRLRRWLHV